VAGGGGQGGGRATHQQAFLALEGRWRRRGARPRSGTLHRKSTRMSTRTGKGKGRGNGKGTRRGTRTSAYARASRLGFRGSEFHDLAVDVGGVGWANGGVAAPVAAAEGTATGRHHRQSAVQRRGTQHGDGHAPRRGNWFRWHPTAHRTVDAAQTKQHNGAVCTTRCGYLMQKCCRIDKAHASRVLMHSMPDRTITGTHEAKSRPHPRHTQKTSSRRTTTK
jgi:hypothetical protein